MPISRDGASVREALPDVALIDAAACAAIGSMGMSWWIKQVQAGHAPAPVIRGARRTRWRLADVRKYWADRCNQPSEIVADKLQGQVARRGKKADKSRR